MFSGFFPLCTPTETGNRRFFVRAWEGTVPFNFASLVFLLAALRVEAARFECRAAPGSVDSEEKVPKRLLR